MKRIIFITCLGLLSIVAEAQPGRFRPEQMTDEEIIRMQTQDIVTWMNLTGETKEQFIREYSAFRKEIGEVAKSAQPVGKLESESEIDEALRKNFEVSEKILQIRKNYYLRFKEFLQPSQIRTMYHIENEVGRRMHNGPGGGPGGPGAPGDPGEPHHRPENPPQPPHPENQGNLSF